MKVDKEEIKRQKAKIKEVSSDVPALRTPRRGCLSAFFDEGVSGPKSRGQRSNTRIARAILTAYTV
ncbi:MAG: hypothetical protein L0220_01750, partial [Acidobacteria bacterium]|nr:hypothetical protein [Acidobacteriota bacterium]